MQGNCDDQFTAVREALARDLDGDDWGRRLAVSLVGDRRRPVGRLPGPGADDAWTQDTIVNVWSTTKCVLSLAALMLVEARELDLYAPVGDYWPEFAAKGKKNVEVRHLMSHTSGVSAWEQPLLDQGHVRLGDRHRAARRAAAVVGAGDGVGLPRGEPGRPGVEVIRRITSETFKTFVAEEIAGRSGRTSRSGRGRPTGTGSRRWWVPPPRPEGEPRRGHDVGGHADVDRSGDVDQGHDDAEVAGRRPGGAERALERARGARRAAGDPAGRRGRRAPLLSQKTIDRIFDVQADGVDLVLEAPFRFGIGFALTPPRPCPTCRGAGGVVGRLGWVDGRHGPRSAADDHLHDEQDGRRPPGLRSRGVLHPRRVLRAGLSSAPWTYDDVVPVADHVTRQARVIDAPPSVVWEELHRLKLSGLPVTLALGGVGRCPVC